MAVLPTAVASEVPVPLLVEVPPAAVVLVLVEVLPAAVASVLVIVAVPPPAVVSVLVVVEVSPAAVVSVLVLVEVAPAAVAIASATAASATAHQVVEHLVASAAVTPGPARAVDHPALAPAVEAEEDLVAGVVEVVVAEVAVAEVVVAEVAVADGSNLRKVETIMKSIISSATRSTALTIVGTLAISCLLFSGGPPQTTAQTKNGTGYATAQEAVEALVAAAEKFDEKKLQEILGPNSSDIIHTGEPARDREMATEFATQARSKQSLSKDPHNSTRLILNVGSDAWPFPVPLMKLAGKWYFDAEVGRREVLLRRIGRNELDAIEICRGYVDAQYDYAMLKHVQPGVNQFAQRIISTPGKQDGLAWQNADGTWEGPVGENIAKAIARGYTSRNEPYRGYFYQVLKGQGPAAPLGELDYVVKGVMIGGFALLATPARYRVTGVKTFMVSQDGVVYEKDLGPNSLEIARRIDRFNPDRSWSPVLEK